MNREDTNHRPTRGDGWRAWGRWLLGRNLCPHEWEDDYEFIASSVLTMSMTTASVRPVSIQTMQACALCGAARRKPGSARPASGMSAGTAETAQQAQGEARQPDPPAAGDAQTPSPNPLNPGN